VNRGSGIWRMTLGIVVAMAAVGALAFASVASASTGSPVRGHVLHLAPGTVGKANTNSSNNWFGYNQGTLEQGSKLFNSITGDWTVPTATNFAPGQAGNSSDWIGIGGGCIDANCTVGDTTLIQTGTEQDVDANGNQTYDAWYEVIPAPSLTITNMTVRPGDHMHAAISEVVANSDVWKITLQDVTRGESFTTTLPYPSTHATAEWIEETPLLIGTNAGLASLPNLTETSFTGATVNGQNANLKASEAIDLTDANGNVIGAPSAPNATADGFSLCAHATSC
jgi:Peptidase A4 family